MTLDDFMKLPYPIALYPDVKQGGYYAEHPDLPGCGAQGNTVDEALASLEDSKRIWIEIKLEEFGEDAIPLPSATLEGKGRYCDE